jgi:hypothetical protein
VRGREGERCGWSRGWCCPFIGWMGKWRGRGEAVAELGRCAINGGGGGSVRRPLREGKGRGGGAGALRINAQLGGGRGSGAGSRGGGGAVGRWRAGGGGEVEDGPDTWAPSVSR